MTKKKKSKKKGGYHHGNLRQALISAALKIIDKQGLNALTLRAVAAAANVSRTAPYRHFQKKEALLAAVAEDGFRVLSENMASLDKEEKDPLERIIRKSLVYVRFAKENPSHFEVMFRFKLRQFTLYPSLFETAAGSMMNIVETVMQCQKVGIVRSDSTFDIAFGAWTMIHGFASLVMNELVPFDIECEESLEKAVRRNAMLYLEGVANRQEVV